MRPSFESYKIRNCVVTYRLKIPMLGGTILDRLCYLKTTVRKNKLKYRDNIRNSFCIKQFLGHEHFSQMWIAKRSDTTFFLTNIRDRHKYLVHFQTCPSSYI